jgi:L-2-hydroxyglutarate oxidase
MSQRFPDFLVIGGGVVGLAIARALKQNWPEAEVTLLEKEADVGLHASGRNSGVLHAGFYYPADSLKARLCVEGNRAMKQYCQTHGLKLNACGKIVVTRSESEIPALEKLYQRGLQNGVRLQWLTAAQAREIEPNAHTCGFALYSPDTATVNPHEVCQQLRHELIQAGVALHLNTQFLYRRHHNVYTTQGLYQPGIVINAAGLYADKIAHQYGFGQHYTLLPFKGIYLGYDGDASVIRTHIYPVPDPRQPFLGVHFTKTAEGKVKIGPTAIPAFWRENYQGFDQFRWRETAEILWYESRLFLLNAFDFRQLALSEMRKYARTYFAGLARELVQEIDVQQFRQFLKPGIRAQLLDTRSLALVQDFVIEGDHKSIHILNAVSPAFTGALAFANYLCQHWIAQNHGPAAVESRDGLK